MAKFRRSHREDYPGSFYGFNHPYRPQGDYDRPWRDHIRSRYDLDRHSYFVDDYKPSYKSRWESEDEDRWSPRDRRDDWYEDESQRTRDRRNYTNTRNENYGHDRWDESGYGWNKLKSDYNYDHQFDRDYERDYNRRRDFDSSDYFENDYDPEEWENPSYRTSNRSRRRWDEDDNWANRWTDNDDYNQRSTANYSNVERPANYRQWHFRDEDSFENVGNYGSRHTDQYRRENNQPKRWRASRRSYSR